MGDYVCMHFVKWPLLLYNIEKGHTALEEQTYAYVIFVFMYGSV